MTQGNLARDPEEHAGPLFAGLAGSLEGDTDHRPPLILLHGLTFDRTMWQPAVAELRKLDPRRCVLAVDLPGHGRSPAAQVPYLFVAGNEIGPDYRNWLSCVLPQATIMVWPASGHFPHLAHPRRFAECLAATARWNAPPRRPAHIGAWAREEL